MRAYSQLADLEVLLTSIPDEKTRAYAGEAIASYSAGAYRSAIVSTWIAVVLDLYQKVLYLDEEYSDPAAKKCIERINKIRNNNDRKQIAAWEREILINAYKDIKIVSEVEYEHLERIQQDRHRCAHPALDKDGFLFQPSPELVRNHIRTATEILLSQPVIVRKASMDAFERDIEHENFPNTEDRIVRALLGRHLPMSKEYRVSIIKFSLRKILHIENVDQKILNRYITVFKHILEEYRQDFEGIDNQFLSDQIKRTKDERYSFFAALLFLEPRLWDMSPPDLQEKFYSYIKNQNILTLKIFTLHIFEIEREKLLILYEQSWLKDGKDAQTILYNLTSHGRAKRIIRTDAIFIQKIVKLTLDAFCSTDASIFFVAAGLIKSVIALMNKDHLELLFEMLSRPEIKGNELMIVRIGIMESVFRETISAFPETISCWEKFYEDIESNKALYPGLSRLGQLINAYPEHEAVVFSYDDIPF
ncbi:hypothetical protein C7293_03240 [filamentous cyanobacterium CCT1]|nr:hypothetical protein C7293_03240 [filamentous cyanobacterium CCT1]PSN81373.1 hypothetical protein C8B47_01775 [filamentous cyanobacterium CCP4]